MAIGALAYQLASIGYARTPAIWRAERKREIPVALEGFSTMMFNRASGPDEIGRYVARQRREGPMKWLRSFLEYWRRWNEVLG